MTGSAVTAAATCCSGGRDNDTLNGGDGDDTLYGEEGDDDMVGDDANESFAGGSGADSIRYGAGQHVIALNLGDAADTVLAPTAAESACAGADVVSLGGIRIDHAAPGRGDPARRAVSTVDGSSGR